MPKFLYHVFLTHDWGTDEAGRDNHARVSKINDVLKANGLVTWFDADRMSGNIKKQMGHGIENSALVAVFITQRYMEKVNGANQNDNCQLEFNMAGNTQTAARLIPIVMEPRMKDQTKWKCEFKLTLGSLLYLDATSDANLLQFSNELSTKIKEMLAKTTLFPNQDDVLIEATKASPTMDVVHVEPPNTTPIVAAIHATLPVPPKKGPSGASAVVPVNNTYHSTLAVTQPAPPAWLSSGGDRLRLIKKSLFVVISALGSSSSSSSTDTTETPTPIPTPTPTPTQWSSLW
ncbi:hypothetical protein SDRG_15527 [Saprolegnia diclina VS20]|uniref:TIR domain-containing protein n=1 Tax=Saprolegnia diclina (strain VS20) TaxID=1156394 RepID=T0RAL5_SAPDV|nr:hypothetical protein SDRG_15527 [Saprolegnia diclina VS20]EQC26587.1 hypothetical protein SDRG_15527 [Saprolegnia diclina VS20]|eukprot:XP_008619925.1 hypothetical protein SDRG_15527 [Saprolegnia diclina VS20]